MSGPPSPASCPEFLSLLDSMAIDESRPSKRARNGEIAYSLPTPLSLDDSESEIQNILRNSHKENKKKTESFLNQLVDGEVNDPMETHPTESAFSPYTPLAFLGAPDLAVPTRKRPRSATNMVTYDSLPDSLKPSGMLSVNFSADWSKKQQHLLVTLPSRPFEVVRGDYHFGDGL